MRTTDNLVQALEGIQFSDPPSTKELWRLLNCIEKGLNVIFAHNPPLREIESLDIALGLLDVDLSGGADAARAELVDLFYRRSRTRCKARGGRQTAQTDNGVFWGTSQKIEN